MPRARHDPSKNLVGFLVGDVMYAVRIEVVREVANPLEVVALPRSPKAVKGVADYRGEVVPVIDLRVRFGLPEAQLSRKTKWVVIDISVRATDQEGPPSLTTGRFAALVVDAVTEVFGYGAGGVRPAPPLGSGDDVRGIEGVTTFDDRLVFVLDTRIFAALADSALVPEKNASSQLETG